MAARRPQGRARGRAVDAARPGKLLTGGVAGGAGQIHPEVRPRVCGGPGRCLRASRGGKRLDRISLPHRPARDPVRLACGPRIGPTGLSDPRLSAMLHNPNHARKPSAPRGQLDLFADGKVTMATNALLEPLWSTDPGESRRARERLGALVPLPPLRGARRSVDRHVGDSGSRYARRRGKVGRSGGTSSRTKMISSPS